VGGISNIAMPDNEATNQEILNK